ncbi:AraC family transcriptional regulator [Paenibacillus sp. EC2-1]|uniref:AraC family transcriptional regulator n=1 Tax=Paenibacillus sp. EC2-1 TaxID=3388665 RepID=UPI003BEEC919
MNHIKNQHNFSSLTMKMWNIEVLKLENEILEQQLTIQPALIILMMGEASLERVDRTIQMSKDVVYFCPANTTFGISGKNAGSVSVVIIYFGWYKESEMSSRNQLEEVNVATVLHNIYDFTLSSADRLNLICRSIYDHSQSDEDFKRWRAQIEFQELLYEMLSSISLQSPSEKKQGLDQTREYIDNHYSDDLTIEQLASIADLSPKYYMDIFKKTYGQSAMEYLAQVRMNKAKQLMLGSQRIVREVAHTVGYKDEFYFSRKFKKEFGLSPSAYIKKRKNKIAIYGSSSLLGYLIPLHVIPYAAPLHPKWSRYYYNFLGPDIPIHLDAYRLNHNKIANLERLQLSQPELIICSPGLEAWERERLLQIAPVYQLPSDCEGWQNQLRWLAHLLDKHEEAEQWIAAFRTKLKSLGCGGDSLGKTQGSQTLLTARLHHHELISHRNLGMREVLFENLGFLAPPLLDNYSADVTLTVKEIKKIDADYMLLLVRQDSETLQYWRQLQSSPDWMTIPAVREGKFHLLSSYPWREYSPMALEQMVEQTPKFFSGNCP